MQEAIEFEGLVPGQDSLWGRKEDPSAFVLQAVPRSRVTTYPVGSILESLPKRKSWGKRRSTITNPFIPWTLHAT